MNLSQIKDALRNLQTISFKLPNGTLVPPHFHVTEVGKITKHFIDCGGAERKEEAANFQLWAATDYNHRLHPEKLLHIIELSQRVLGLEDLPVEVEYQGETIGKFGLHFDGTHFLLTSKQTDCLAQDQCGVPQQKPKKELSQLSISNTCTPGGGCC